MLTSLLLFSSCHGSEGTTETSETKEKYINTYNVHPEVDTSYSDVGKAVNYDGYEFKFLNSSEFDGLYVYIDPDMTGEFLDDSIFERNLITEHRFNIIITEEAKPYEELASHARTIILADEGVYDAMYLPINQLTPLISEKLFHDLFSIDELNMQRVWWDQNTVKNSILNDSLYFATSDLHLMAFEKSKCVFMNSDILDELPIPVDAVYNGEWTLELMKKYCAECSTLNGISASLDSVPAMAYAMGAEPVGRNIDGKYVFTADADGKFKNIFNLLDALWNGNDGIATAFDSGMEHIELYAEGKALFIIDELRNAPMIVEKVDATLILPLPLYEADTSPEYKAPYTSDCLAFCIPRTNIELQRTGVIVDYLTYESYAEIMPRYYSSRINEIKSKESYNIDILALLRGCRSIGAADAYGWLGDITAYPDLVFQEEYKGKITAAIEKTYSEYPAN